MGLLPAQYLTHLRNNHPHAVKAYLSIINPEVVYCGTVTGSPARGAMDITVSTVSGNIANVVAGMTVYVGTACGDYSKGKRRYKSRSGLVLTLDENTVVWQAGDYITIVRHFELWSVFPYITETEPYTFYKDRNIAYTDENKYPKPVAIQYHQAGLLTGASKQFTLDASDSYTIAYGATISSVLWECSSGSIADNDATTTTITFTSVGTYWVKLTVTDSNGKSQSTWRLIRLHNTTSDAPYANFALTAPMVQDWSSYGWRTTIEMYESVDIDSIPDDAIVILWCTQTFDGTEYYYVDNILLFGYLRRSSITHNYDVGSVSFDIETINAQLLNSHMMSVSLEYSTNPDTWYKYYKLTLARAIHHYWRHHSTLFDVANVFLPMSETTEIPATDDFEEGNLLDNVETFAWQHGIFAHVMIDKHNSVHVQQDIHMLGTTARDAVSELFDITDEDRLPNLEIVENIEPTLGHVIVSGGRRDPNDNTLEPIISQAPGEVPYNRGAEKNIIEYLIISSQSAGNVLAGRVLYNINRKIEELQLQLAGNWHEALEIIPQYWINVPNILNVRDVDISGRYTFKNVSSQLDVHTGVCTSNVVLIPEVDSVDGIPGPYPPEVEEGPEDGGGEGENPPWTPPVPPPPIPTDEFADAYVATVTQVKGSADFDVINPTWNSKYSGISGDIIDACKKNEDVIYALTESAVFKTEDFQSDNPIWTEVYNVAEDENLVSNNPFLLRILVPKSMSTIGHYVFVLAVTGSSSGGDANLWLIKTNDGGEIWEDVNVVTVEDAILEYTLTVSAASGHHEAGGGTVYVDMPHERVGDDESTYNPWVIALLGIVPDDVGGAWYGYAPNFPDDPDAYQISINGSNTIHDDINPVTQFNGGLTTYERENIAKAWVEESFGAEDVGWSNINDNATMPKDAARINVRVSLTHGSADWDGSFFSWVWWHKPTYYKPKAFACGYHDGSHIYIGLDDKIIRSVDIGETWEDYITDIGANDIECPAFQNPSDDDIIFWATDGHLYRSTANSKGSSIYLEQSPVAEPYRIASDPSSEIIYAMPKTSGGTYIINKHENGSTTPIAIGVDGGTSLGVQPGSAADVRRVYWLTDADIKYTEDDETIVSKLGDWGAFASPVRIQPL